MVRIVAVNRMLVDRAATKESRIPSLAVLLSIAIACSAFFIPASGVAQDLTASPADTSSKFEQTAWQLIHNSDDPADFETYLEIYPNGRFNFLAKRRITELKEQRRRSRAFVPGPTPSAPSLLAPQPQLSAPQSTEPKLTAIRFPTPPRNKINLVPKPANVPVLAPVATRQIESKHSASAVSQPVNEPEPVDPLNCALGGMDVD